MALLTGDRPTHRRGPTSKRPTPSLVCRCPNGRPAYLGETWLMLWRARPDDDAPLDRAIALLSQARTDSSPRTRGWPGLSLPRPVGALGTDPRHG